MNNLTDVHQRIEAARKAQAEELDLSNLDLTALPSSIGKLTDLKRLNLSKNNLQALPSAIGQLKKLEYLNLWSNSLLTLPEEVGQLKALIEIDLEDNYFAEIPKSLFQLTQLRILDIEHNGLTGLSNDIQALKNLKELDLSRNRITQIPPIISELSALRILNLKSNLLEKLPGTIALLSQLIWLNVKGNFLDTNLEEATQNGQNEVRAYFTSQLVQEKIQSAKENALLKLDLSNLNISEIPSELFELTTVKILTLEGNDIWEIPNEITKMKSLEVLDLSHNQLVSVPNILNRLPNLKIIETEGNPIMGSGLFPAVEIDEAEVEKRIAEVKKNHSEKLDLTHCGLTSIPEAVFQLTWLKELVLGKSYHAKEDIKHRNYIIAIDADIQKLSNLQKLDVSGNILSNLPDSLSSLSQLNTLILHQNQFRKLPEVLYKLQFNLKTLDLSENLLLSLPNEIAALKNLETLNVADNQLDIIPDFIGELKNGRSFNFSKNKIKKITEQVSHLSLLEYFNCSNNELEILPDMIGELKNIQVLDFSNNAIENLPETLQGWNLGLKSLNLYNNQLSELPEIFKTFIKLEKINLGKNNFTEIPEILLGLPAMARLSLSYNKVKEIPEGILAMKNLQYLDLKNNRLDRSLVKPIQKGIKGIKEWFLFKAVQDKIQEAKETDAPVLDIANFALRTIPKEIFELSALKTLIIGKIPEKEDDKNLKNNITDLPRSFSKLVNLEAFYAPYNNIVTLPTEIEQLENLKILDVSNNKLKTLPSTLGNLTKLETLNINHNQLKDVPYDLANLKNIAVFDWKENPLQPTFKAAADMPLEELKSWLQKGWIDNTLKDAAKNNVTSLDLSGLGLEGLPKALFQLKKLKKLDLSNNQLRHLSKSIANLSYLEHLQLADNNLEDLPGVLANMRSLKQLEVSGNPMTSIPENVVNQGCYAIKQWMKQQAINEQAEAILLESNQNGHISPLQNAEGEAVCQVCHGTKTLTGDSIYLNMTFENQTCYGCNGSAIATYDTEKIHALLHNAQEHLNEVKSQLDHIIRQKKGFEQSILFSHATNNDVVTSQVRKGFQSILERYNKQLQVTVNQYEFYKTVKSRLHSLLYNQYLMYCTMDEFRKVDYLEASLTLNIDEKSSMLKDLVGEVTDLSSFVLGANNLAIPFEFMDDVALLSEKYQAMLL